ncbi:MAG: SUMF1/EgtB/PvdO family nonheme iron enzyme, partial [Acidobacteria bacterium]|nr:SUMF1/EgtB/PvdO family nonheme iron enzyme [Acidobacteriota bacterium]
STDKFVPVLFSPDQERFIPEPLRGRTFYQPEAGQAAYDALYDFLLDQTGIEPCEVGELKLKPRRKATPLSFNNESGQSTQRKQELAYLDNLKAERLRERYVAMGSKSEEQHRFYEDWCHKVEFLPLDKDGNPLPQSREFDDAVEAIREVRRAALLGEPGGGKTTAIWKLILEMIETARQNDQAPIPLLVELRFWTQADQSLPDFIVSRLKGLGVYLDNLLSSERAALLLDGLNELPRDQWANKHEQVREFFEQNPELLAVVSCRKDDYPRELGFDCINISPLDPLRIREFVCKYLDSPERGKDMFWKLAETEAQKLHQQFLEKFGDRWPDAEQIFWLKPQLPDGIRWGRWAEDNRTWERWVGLRDDKSSMLGLASNPFMLTMLASVYKDGNDLPKNRGNLFRSFVQMRLRRELQGNRILATEIKPLEDAMARVAFEMQSHRATKNDEDTGGALTVLSKNEVFPLLGENPQRMLSLASNAGLLNTDDQIRFTHQLLQEYFAARHMQIKFEAGDWKASQIWRPAEWWERTNWEVAAVLFAGLYNNDCTKAVEWVAEANPEVAAQCIDLSGVGHTLNADARKRLTKEWTDRLTNLKSDSNPKARAAVGRALAITRWDYRKGVGVVDGLPDIEWKEIPEGEFLYGEKSQKLTLPTFWISRFPVTYAQFQTFVDDPEGLKDTRWFEGLAASEEEHQAGDQAFKFDNHPRERVSWYQAMAFCRWLSWRMGTTFDLKKVTEWAVRLPTEFEWVKAARGTDGRLYPYGNDFDQTKGNTYETGIGQTSAVGIFPNGASPYGVEEMSGNVWEWCLTDYGKPQIEARKENLGNDNTRVLRGGSWGSGQVYARAVCRYYVRPANRDFNFGFRVLCCRPPSL